jgi:hypothetical protein
MFAKAFYAQYAQERCDSSIFPSLGQGRPKWMVTVCCKYDPAEDPGI